MDCKKAQRWHDELAEGRLAETQATDLRRHLSECTDCRVAQQRATRLQQLLALKRHELPPPAYFANFTNEFHRRLAAEEARAPWWQQVADRLAWSSLPALRYASATLAGVLLTLGAFHWTQSNSVVPSPIAQQAPAEAASLTTASATPTPGLRLMPAALESAADAGYVLDRIAVTPASYEGGSVRF